MLCRRVPRAGSHPVTRHVTIIIQHHMSPNKAGKHVCSISHVNIAGRPTKQASMFPLYHMSTAHAAQQSKRACMTYITCQLFFAHALVKCILKSCWCLTSSMLVVQLAWCWWWWGCWWRFRYSCYWQWFEWDWWWSWGWGPCDRQYCMSMFLASNKAFVVGSASALSLLRTLSPDFVCPRALNLHRLSTPKLYTRRRSRKPSCTRSAHANSYPLLAAHVKTLSEPVSQILCFTLGTRQIAHDARHKLIS